MGDFDIIPTIFALVSICRVDLAARDRNLLIIMDSFAVMPPAFALAETRRVDPGVRDSNAPKRCKGVARRGYRWVVRHRARPVLPRPRSCYSSLGRDGR